MRMRASARKNADGGRRARLVFGCRRGRAVRQAPYNRAGLPQRLADISDESLDWVETLDRCEQPLEVEDVDDDLQRGAFYNIAKAAVHTCSAKLADAGVPYKRPEDYCGNGQERQAWRA